MPAPEPPPRSGSSGWPSGWSVASQRVEQIPIAQHRYPELLGIGVRLEVAVDALQLIVEAAHQTFDQGLGLRNSGTWLADELGLNLFEALPELGELRREVRLTQWLGTC